ncbi:hypothetical protein BHF71_02770 [Vulcanibacillus modesticaldus]|uniref:Uncharacterized protein n=1 Tax=Vulcanibacillus modesticaldus TaxID=337097 RepID=A0A1D2YT64_9BACI|nr:hypothetical protein [Vulcanibacillus modesticaldus]OEF98867.1 hypothetical protein BHF71_02770 [Vulcanibacillus modesticaldus]
MLVKEIQDFHEFSLDGLAENIHVIYEKVCQVKHKLNEKFEVVGSVEHETYEEISVYEDSGSLVKKASYRIGKDVNNKEEALNLISQLFVHKLSA